MSHPNKEFLLRYLAPLKGATIVDVSVNEEDWQAWPVLHVTLAGEQEPIELEIGMDEEGNGPGVIFGLPFPEPETEENA